MSTLFFVAGAVVWAVAALTHHRAVRAACRWCGRGSRWSPGGERRGRVRALRVGQVAVLVAGVVALFYPALRLPWIFGVPVGLAVALVAMGRSVVVELWGSQERSLLTVEPLHTMAFASMAVWGVALGVATVAYAVRRRAECSRCGRGLPEVVPGEVRSSA